MVACLNNLFHNCVKWLIDPFEYQKEAGCSECIEWKHITISEVHVDFKDGAFLLILWKYYRFWRQKALPRLIVLDPKQLSTLPEMKNTRVP